MTAARPKASSVTHISKHPLIAKVGPSCRRSIEAFANNRSDTT